MLSPAAGEPLTNSQPLLSALVADDGVGIDPDTVEMQVDRQAVSASYISDTGQLLYLPDTELQSSLHTITVSASDAAGNSSQITTAFTYSNLIYLPIITK